LLSKKVEQLDWQSLTSALADLDVPTSSQVVGPALAQGLGPQLVDSTQLANAFMSRWLTGQSPASVDSLKTIQEQLKRHIDTRVFEAVSEFKHVCGESLIVALDGPLDLDVTNCVAAKRALERRQFLTIFPALGNKVFAHDASLFWRGIRRAIDDRKSPVKAIAQQVAVRPSTIRAMKGVNRATIGEYFFAHMEELIRILDQIPVEHHPGSSDRWNAFCKSYAAAKAFFGQSDSARLVVVAKLRHDLKILANASWSTNVKFGADEARSIDQFRQGLIGTVFIAQLNGSNFPKQPDASKAGIHVRVDRFLGALSWQRLVALSKKWNQSLACAAECRAVELEFLQSKGSFFDFLDGKFLATSGYQIGTLLNAAALKNQGDAMHICLSQAIHRSDYAQACGMGRRTILEIRNVDRHVQSTLELDVRLRISEGGKQTVDFDVLQHQGPSNGLASHGARMAVAELLSALRGKPLQARAVQGIRLSAAKRRSLRGAERVNLTLAVSGFDAFETTFGDKSKDLWTSFMG
jgi:hypothetical protein